jgi:2-methylfumaryl-CoA isomerase
MEAAAPSGEVSDPAGVLPLDGLRVIEISAYVAAPLAGLTLAQLGADVIRVEPIGGAADRARWPLHRGTSLYWSGLNKGKRAIEVDFAAEEGRELVADLIVRAGIAISNTERYPDLTYAALCERRADLIHAQLTGTRDGGTAVDYTVQAATGFPLLTGPADSTEPVNHVLPAWDVAAGLYLATGLLAAERHRLRTGEGRQLKVALTDVALATTGNLGYLAEAQLSEDPRPRCGNHVYGEFGRDFVTADGVRLMLVVLTTRHWRDLVSMTAMTEAVAALEKALDADFDRAADRFRHRVVLAALVAEWFVARPIDEVESALNETRLLWARYRSFAEWAADGARLLRDSPLMAELDQPGVGAHLAPGSPVVVADAPAVARPAPRMGQHTEEVLRTELGLTPAQVQRLRDRGVLGGGEWHGERN